ncbi:MAG: bacteriohemerythrin [Desulfuromonadaceae bacterium]|nr:bacteriohemerythrin [Desulfuromonadaceae bacterium]
MPIIVWNADFILGVQQFDEHHHHLVDLLNQAYDDFIAGAGSDSINKILDELVDYATYHFAAEEHWMSEMSYPMFDEHRAEHNRFSSRVAEMLKDCNGDRMSLWLEVMTFLNNWLTNHILKSDARYGHYIAAKGISLHLV